jgi:hypothetical protein
MQHVYPAGAGDLDNLNVGRIVQAHAAGQVAGRVCAVFAAEGQNPGLEIILCHIIQFASPW